MTWLWKTTLEQETEEGLQRAVAEGLIIAQMSMDTWLPRREGEDQQQIASVCWPTTKETGIRPQKPETEDSVIVGHVGDDKEEIEIVTLNINSMRQAIADGSLLAYVKGTTADFYCLQETMIGVDSKDWKVTAFLRELQGMGYFWYLNAATRNKGGYGGTAVITKHQPDHVHLGLGNSLIDREGRFMALEYDKWIVINSYVPTLQLDLSGGERKELFFSATTDKVTRLRQLHKTKRFLWAGDINVCRLEIDHTAFDPEFPGCSPPERARLEQVLKELDMTDTMPEEQQKENRFTYYDRRSDSNNAWRLDYVFIDRQREGSVAAKILKAKPVIEGGPKSDHLAVSVSFETDEPITRNSYVAIKQSEQQTVNTRVLIHDGYEGARPGRPLPATVVAIAGDLLRVRIDQRWIPPCTPAFAGVSPHDVTKMTKCPPRWEKGDEVEHKRSGKTGKVIYLEEDSTPDTTEGGTTMYVVKFKGDKTARRCVEKKIRKVTPSLGEQAVASLTATQRVRVARAVAKSTTKPKLTKEDSQSCGCDLHQVCAINCGVGLPDLVGESDIEESDSDNSEGDEEGDFQTNTHRDGTHALGCCDTKESQEKTVCQCNHQDGGIPNEEETNNEGPSVPMIQMTHVRGVETIQQQTQRCVAEVLLDTGAFTCLVSLAWLQKTYPETWKNMLNKEGATGTKFSLADGSRAKSPLGRVNLAFQLGTQDLKLSNNLWVLDGLAHDVILGSNFLDMMGTTISYGKRTLTFDAREGMTPIPFKMSDKNRYWRRPAQVRPKMRITLQPGETQTVPVRTDGSDLRCLNEKERRFGTLHTAGRTLSWEIGAKAQCLSIGEGSNATVSLTNHTTKVLEIGTHEVIAAFMPTDRRSLHVLGGAEDQLERRREGTKSRRMTIEPPVRTVWPAAEYQRITDILMNETNIAGVVLIDARPAERVWSI